MKLQREGSHSWTPASCFADWTVFSFSGYGLYFVLFSFSIYKDTKGAKNYHFWGDFNYNLTYLAGFWQEKSLLPSPFRVSLAHPSPQELRIEKNECLNVWMCKYLSGWRSQINQTIKQSYNQSLSGGSIFSILKSQMGTSKNSFYSLSCLHEDSRHQFVRFVQFVFESNNLRLPKVIRVSRQCQDTLVWFVRGGNATWM